MKITLDARHEQARKIAMCFVGEPLDRPRAEGETKLIGCTQDKFVWEHLDRLINSKWTGGWDKITIDLSTARFDPFVAMREGVWCRCRIGDMPILTTAEQVFYHINECGVHNITLDHEHYRGCEGVELEGEE